MPIRRPFLTSLDDRAAVKGSRDPLGLQSIWTRFGRHVVGNLTTVASSVRDYGVLLLGYHLAESVAEEHGPESTLATFLKWEQLCGYVRASVLEDWSFRGTEKVRRVLDDGDRLTLSADRTHQLLGNQKIYGLWGLYTVPARTSGLLEGDPPRLTPPSRELVDALYLPRLATVAGPDARKLVAKLAPPSVKLSLSGSDRRLAEALAAVLSPTLHARERELFREHLLFGGPSDSTQGRQRQLAGLLQRHLGADVPFSTTAIRALAKEARREEHEALAGYLEHIAIVESLIGPCSRIFSWLLGLDGRKLDEASRDLKKSLGAIRTINPAAVRALQGELADGTPEVGARFVRLAETAAAGEYREFVALLVEQNRWVMSGRGGTAWITIERDTLQVRFRDESGSLPGRDDLASLWRFPYFLDSLRSVARQLEAP